MTDIVERLRETETDCYTPPEIARECREAADEIERLRGAYEQERKDCINLTEKVIPNLRNEIERLQFSADAAHQVADDLENEIERLRGLLRICMRRWIPFAEVELRASVMEAAHCDADGNIK